MGSKLWQTPRPYFAQRWALHHFTVDAAASASNALVRPSDSLYASWGEECDPCGTAEDGFPVHYVGRYYTEETDGLKAEHYEAGDRVWCNPPYDTSIARWLDLAAALAHDVGVLWDVLLPPSVDTRWFHKYLWNDRAGHWRDGVEAHFLPYRIAFIDPTTAGRSAPRAGNLQVTFWPEAR